MNVKYIKLEIKNMPIVFEDSAITSIIKKQEVSTAIREDVISLFGASLPKVRGKIPLVRAIMQECAQVKLRDMSKEEKCEMYIDIYTHIFQTPAVSPEEIKNLKCSIEYLDSTGEIEVPPLRVRAYRRVVSFFRSKK